jgi:hypothetical protein
VVRRDTDKSSFLRAKHAGFLSSSALFLPLSPARLVVPPSLWMRHKRGLASLNHKTQMESFQARCGVVARASLPCSPRKRQKTLHTSLTSCPLSPPPHSLYLITHPTSTPSHHACPAAQTRRRRCGRLPTRLQLHHHDDARPPSHGLATCPSGCALPLPVHPLSEHDN